MEETKMNIIKTIKTAAAGAVTYAAATLGIGCSTMPLYDVTNDASLVRFENKQNLTDRLNCWHRIDIQSAGNSNFEGFLARLVPEYDLSKGLSAAGQYVAKPGEDIARLGLAYGKKIGANKFAKFRLFFPAKKGSTPEINAIFVYNSDNYEAGVLILYDPENNTMHGELTATFGKSNVKPFVQLVGYGPIDDLEGKVLIGLQLRPKK